MKKKEKAILPRPCSVSLDLFKGQALPRSSSSSAERHQKKSAS